MLRQSLITDLRDLKQTTTVTAMKTERKEGSNYNSIILPVIIGRIIPQHVLFKTLYISYPSPAKHQREITKIYIVQKCKHRRKNI